MRHSRNVPLSGSDEQYSSRALSAALQEAQQEAKRLKDEYVSTEHLLLALVAKAGAVFSRCSKLVGCIETMCSKL